MRGFLAGLLMVSSLAFGDEAHAPHFRFERPVLPGAAGPNRLEPDVPLLAHAAGGMADLRLFDAAGREAPYLLVDPPRREPEWRAGQLLPMTATKTASGFEVDLGLSATIDRVRITGL
ncbi:MAG TPA: hypothetical protein VII86_15870, partial [Thermoanaerobaculia bacterium]